MRPRKQYPSVPSRSWKDVRDQERMREKKTVRTIKRAIKDSDVFVFNARLNKKALTRITDSITYSLLFQILPTDIAYETGLDAFAQIILTPGRLPFFTQNIVDNYDSFKVTGIHWTYVPPTTDVALVSTDRGPVYPYTNSTLRFIVDPTTNITSVQNVRDDMNRYYVGSTVKSLELPAFATKRNTISKIASSIARKNGGFIGQSVEMMKGYIAYPLCSVFSNAGQIGIRSDNIIETSTAWRAFVPNGGFNQDTALCPTYGTLSVAIPRLINKNPFAENNAEGTFPTEIAYLTLTYTIDCYGQN